MDLDVELLPGHGEPAHVSTVAGPQPHHTGFHGGWVTTTPHWFPWWLGQLALQLTMMNCSHFPTSLLALLKAVLLIVVTAPGVR